MIKVIYLLFVLFITSCIPVPESDNSGKAYYLKAYLESGKPVGTDQGKINVKLVRKYGFDLGDTTTKEDLRDEFIGDADVSLFLDGEEIPLTVETYRYRDYSSEHIVVAGGHYIIKADIFDTVQNKVITLTAETTVPPHDTTMSIDQDTLWIDPDHFSNEFLQMHRNPSAYPHLKLSLASNNYYHLYDFAGSGSAIPGIWIPENLNNLPMQGDRLIISPLQMYRTNHKAPRIYENYTMVVHHLNEEYADLYVNNGPGSETWQTGETDLVPYGISNVSNGAGIFTGITSDTLKLFVRAVQNEVVE